MARGVALPHETLHPVAVRIAELRARERYDDILYETIRRHLSLWLQDEFSVSSGGAGQNWWEHRIFSAYLPSGARSEVRRFLADQVRYTSIRHRRFPQYLVGSLAATPLGVRVASAKKLVVTPNVPKASHLTILPGNRRIRIFDLVRRRSRVMLKDGFDNDAIAAEFAVRGGRRQGPFPPILDGNLAEGWFTEPVFDGRVLARIPNVRKAQYFRDLAWRNLNAWAAPTRSYWTLAEWWERHAAARSHLREHVSAVEECLAQEATITVQASHGDFQPGNILVDLSKGAVWLLDWEFYGTRSIHYDAIVLLAGLRWPERAGRALERLLLHGADCPSFVGLDGRQRRRAILVALVEDIALRLRGWSPGNTQNVPPEIASLRQCIAHILEVAPE